MNGQFQQESFNHFKLSQLIDVLAQKGFDMNVEWKNNTKKVDEPDAKTNFFELKYKGKLLFRQNRTVGFANMLQLDDTEKTIFLQALKTGGFYTKPAWALGLGLLLLYVGLSLLVAFTREESFLSVILLVSMVFTLVLSGAIYFWATGKISEKSLPYFYVFGIGYLFTAPSSMLVLPLLRQCFRLHLYREVVSEDMAAG